MYRDPRTGNISVGTKDSRGYKFYVNGDIYADNLKDNTSLIYQAVLDKLISEGYLVNKTSETYVPPPITIGANNDDCLKAIGTPMQDQMAVWVDKNHLKGSSSISGNYAVISGTPADNELTTWTDATHIQGESGLTWDETQLYVNGKIGIGITNPYGIFQVVANSTDNIVFAGLGGTNIDSPVLRLAGSTTTSSPITGPSLRAVSTGIYGRHRLAIFQHDADDYTTENEVISILADGDLQVKTSSIGTDNYISETTGWQGTYAGDFDVRSIYTDALIAKSFIADVDLALLSGQMISKSVTQVSRDFTVPANGNADYLYVEALPGHPTSQVFEDNDWIRLQVIDRSGGGLIWTEVWGQIQGNFVDDGGGEQHYIFISRDDGGVSGSTIYAGAGAQDVGQSGNGYIQQEAGSYSLYTPYIQVATWETDPSVASNITVRNRLGNLAGITGQVGFGFVTRKDNTNYVSQYWNTDSDWGLKGMVAGDTVFQLGSTNVIAGFTIDQTEGLYAGLAATRVQMKAGAGFWAGATAIGDAPFSVTNTGVLKAESGTIGGWNINATDITGGNATLASSGVLTLGTGNDVAIISSVDATYRLWVGDATPASAPFSVSKVGELKAESGRIGDWNISGGGIIDETDQAYIITRNSSTGPTLEARIGNNVFPSAVGVAGLTYFKINGSFTSSPYGLTSFADNTNTSYGTYAAYLEANRNSAFQESYAAWLDGPVVNVNHTVHFDDVSVNLNHSHTVVKVAARTGYSIVKLPGDPIDGMKVTIINDANSSYKVQVQAGANTDGYIREPGNLSITDYDMNNAGSSATFQYYENRYDTDGTTVIGYGGWYIISKNL